MKRPYHHHEPERYAVRRNPAHPTTFQVIDLQEDNPAAVEEWTEYAEARKAADRLNGKKP